MKGCYRKSMMVSPLISIIVPVYNVEKYIRRCVDSLINQTYRNLEIILVDDGSPDNSGAICDEYAKLDSRIKVIHKENGGVSSARNVGLDNASGEYIGFIDADDYIDLQMYEVLCNNMVNNGVQISMGIYALENGKGEFIPHYRVSLTEVLDKAQTIAEMLKQVKYTCSLCDKLFSSKLIGDIRFDETISHNEDLLFVYQLMKNSEKAVYTSKPMYYYCNNEQSASRVSFSDKNTTMLKAQTMVLEDIKENIPEIYDVALTEYVKTVIFNLDSIARSGYQNKEYIEKLRKIVKDNLKFFLKSYVAKGYKMRAVLISLGFGLYKKFV